VPVISRDSNGSKLSVGYRAQAPAMLDTQRSDNQLINQLMKQEINELMNQSINHSLNQINRIG